jgi:ABC-type uncharacterized transport system ATPase subunit
MEIPDDIPRWRADMTDLAVETEGLCRRFGELEAVRNVNLRVEAGQFFGFLGPNAAGKSTTIRMLTGRSNSQSRPAPNHAGCNQLTHKKQLGEVQCFDAALLSIVLWFDVRQKILTRLANLQEFAHQ